MSVIVFTNMKFTTVITVINHGFFMLVNTDQHWVIGKSVTIYHTIKRKYVVNVTKFWQ